MASRFAVTVLSLVALVCLSNAIHVERMNVVDHRSTYGSHDSSLDKDKWENVNSNFKTKYNAVKDYEQKGYESKASSINSKSNVATSVPVIVDAPEKDNADCCCCHDTPAPATAPAPAPAPAAEKVTEKGEAPKTEVAPVVPEMEAEEGEGEGDDVIPEMETEEGEDENEDEVEDKVE